MAKSKIWEKCLQRVESSKHNTLQLIEKLKAVFKEFKTSNTLIYKHEIRFSFSSYRKGRVTLMKNQKCECLNTCSKF